MRKVIKKLTLLTFAIMLVSCGGASSDSTYSKLTSNVESSNSDIVYITPYGERYHREYCSTIRGHNVSAISLEEAENNGRTPCRRCNP